MKVADDLYNYWMFYFPYRYDIVHSNILCIFCICIFCICICIYIYIYIICIYINSIVGLALIVVLCMCLFLFVYSCICISTTISFKSYSYFCIVLVQYSEFIIMLLGSICYFCNFLPYRWHQKILIFESGSAIRINNLLKTNCLCWWFIPKCLINAVNNTPCLVLICRDIR